jgi:hypothetical protein
LDIGLRKIFFLQIYFFTAGCSNVKVKFTLRTGKTAVPQAQEEPLQNTGPTKNLEFGGWNGGRLTVLYMILFHVPASRIRAILRHQQINRMNPTVPTIPAKIANAVILSALPTKISIIAWKNLWNS